MDDFGKTYVSVVHSVFHLTKDFPFIQIRVPGKVVDLRCSGNRVSGEAKALKLESGEGVLNMVR